MHENQDYYSNCRLRERNQGLFIADRNLQGQTAIYTRQNNNGQRRGYECPEERDYYPYWHPTPWRVRECGILIVECMSTYSKHSGNDVYLHLKTIKSR